MTAPAPESAFLLAEDDAMKSYLKDTVFVSDSSGRRSVPVYFGMPEKELHELSYPSLILELIDIGEATERVMRGPANPVLHYHPAGWTEPPEGFAEGKVLLPQPFDLTYQITTMARHPRHDRQMLATLHAGPLKVRGSGLPVAGDQTIRRLDRVGFTKRDTVDTNRKRVFRNVFTYRVSAELFPEQWQNLVRAVQRVVITTDASSVPFTTVELNVDQNP